MDLKNTGDLIDSIDNVDGNLKPAVNEFVKGLSTLGQAFNASLAPLRGYIWAIEQIEAYISTRAAERFKSRSPTEIKQPNLRLAGSAINYLRLSSSEGDERIKEMFADLILSSMDVKTSHLTHPCYVEIVSQLDGLEADILDRLVRSENGLLAARSICQYGFMPYQEDEKIFSGGPFICEGLKDLWQNTLKDLGFEVHRTAATCALQNLIRLNLVTVTSLREHKLSKNESIHVTGLQRLCLTEFGARFLHLVSGFENA